MDNISTINIVASIIVLIALAWLLLWVFRKLATFFDTLKFASQGCNSQGQAYVTENRMEEYYKNKAVVATVQPQATTHK